MAEWTRELPIAPGIFDHRNLENAGGRAPIRERVVFVGYVNWPEDAKLGHGTKPMPLGSGKLRACRIEHPMTTDSLTVQEWGGEWRRIDGVTTCQGCRAEAEFWNEPGRKCVACIAGVRASEIDRLRAEQAASVMPQIGPLLDAWDGMDNDTKAVLREEAPDLARALSAISRAMDGTDGVKEGA